MCGAVLLRVLLAYMKGLLLAYSRASLALSELRKGAAKEEGRLPSVGDASYRVCAHEHEDGGIV